MQTDSMKNLSFLLILYELIFNSISVYYINIFNIRYERILKNRNTRPNFRPGRMDIKFVKQYIIGNAGLFESYSEYM